MDDRFSLSCFHITLSIGNRKGKVGAKSKFQAFPAMLPSPSCGNVSKVFYVPANYYLKCLYRVIQYLQCQVRGGGPARGKAV